MTRENLARTKLDNYSDSNMHPDELKIETKEKLLPSSSLFAAKFDPEKTKNPERKDFDAYLESAIPNKRPDVTILNEDSGDEINPEEGATHVMPKLGAHEEEAKDCCARIKPKHIAIAISIGLLLLGLLTYLIYYIYMSQKVFYVRWTPELDWTGDHRYKIDQYLPEESDMVYDRYIVGFATNRYFDAIQLIFNDGSRTVCPYRNLGEIEWDDQIAETRVDRLQLAYYDTDGQLKALRFQSRINEEWKVAASSWIFYNTRELNRSGIQQVHFDLEVGERLVGAKSSG